MKALVYTGPQNMVLRDEPEPGQGGNEAVVQVEAVGICGSDLHAYLGHDERRPPPLILGHEAAGTVLEGPMAGKRVAINPLVTCGKCRDCLGGRANLCGARQIISMPPRQGAFAEFVSVPERNLLEVPDDMDIAVAALSEPVATSLHAVGLAQKFSHRPLSEARSLVIGGGAIGVAAALVLSSQGCRKIFLSDTNLRRRRTAMASGVCETFDPVNGGGPDAGTMDVVIDAVGAKASRIAAIKAARPGSVIVHVGLLDGAEGVDARRLTLQEIALVGSYTYSMVDFHAALSALHVGALGSTKWFEERELAAGPAAFSDLSTGQVDAAKIILRL